jgi:tRNA pseudouridine38-40 synthase
LERRVRIDLAYDGTGYAGWQLQPGQPTVQGALEQVLGRIHEGREVRVRGASRTDAGVHARAQVADAVVLDRFDDAELLRALTSLLPEDIRPIRVVSVPDGFHAQHHAREKTYRYLIDTSRHGDPFLSRFAIRWPHAMDVAAIDAALALLPGRRDWSGFTGAACTMRDRVRTLTSARREVVDEGRTAFVFAADGFLTHMARNLVGTMLDLGVGRYGPDRIHEILESGDRARAGPTAPAKGLCLDGVRYEESPNERLW